MQPPSGVTALFTKNAIAEYTVAYAVQVTLFDGGGRKRGSARAQSRVRATLLEGADETDKRKLWDKLMHDAARKLDAELQKQVPQGLPGLTRER